MLADNVRTNVKEIRDTVFSISGRKILLVIGIVLIAVLIFHAGVVVGSHRHFRGGEEQRFGFRPAPGMIVMHMPRGFIEGGHGTVGTVEQTATSSLTVRMRDGSTATILLKQGTVIRDLDGDASSSVIMAGQSIIVLGVPNDDGTISADLIRVVPSGLQPQR